MTKRVARMKNVFLIICFSYLFSLNGMDNVACVFSQDNAHQELVEISRVKYAKLYFYETKIAFAKGNVCDADGIVDLLVGHKNALHKKLWMSPSLMVNSFYRYGRYAFNHAYNYHMEGVICSPVPSISADMQSCKIIDAQQDLHVVKKILYLEYTKVLGAVKRQFPHVESIALSSLGTDIGFPTEMTIPVAVKAICKFIKRNPNTFSEIFLFVKTQSLIKRYIDMFEMYTEYCELFD